MTQPASLLTSAQHLNGNTWAQFLDYLHGGGAYGYWWTLDETKTYQIKRTSWWPVGKPLPLPNGDTEHVYFGVHPAVGIPQERIGRDRPYMPKPEYTRPLVTEIAAVNCLFAEFDAKDFADEKLGALEHIDRLPLKPSAPIDSGGGYHAYWLLVEPTAADLDRARALIVDDLLIDFPFVSDPDRAHAVALFLLPFVRELIAGPTLLHLIEAPTMGSGKGLLADGGCCRRSATRPPHGARVV
jgi:hypothetical protein